MTKKLNLKAQAELDKVIEQRKKSNEGQTGISKATGEIAETQSEMDF